MLSEQVVCVSESFILMLVKEESFGSWKLHLPSHQFITEFSTRRRTKGRTIQSILAEEQPINQHGNLTSCSHLARHRCSGVGRQGGLTPLSLLYVCYSHQARFAPACRAGRIAAKSTEAAFVSICFCH